MNGKSFKFGITIILFAVIFIFGGCQQPIETGDRSRDGAFEKDSLLIEVWDSSTPQKFLGYDTGMTGMSDYYSNNRTIILTSKGYCVELYDYYFSSYYFEKHNYGGRSSPDRDQGVPYDEPRLENATGTLILYKTSLVPTANDTPYLGGSSGRFISNYVFYNGGTYYTYASEVREAVKFPPNFRILDVDGMMLTCNDSILVAWQDLKEGWSPLVGETVNLYPLKKIGGYAELGLPNPDNVRLPFIYKIKP